MLSRMSGPHAFAMNNSHAVVMSRSQAFVTVTLRCFMIGWSLWVL